MNGGKMPSAAMYPIAVASAVYEYPKDIGDSVLPDPVWYPELRHEEWVPDGYSWREVHEC
jgi:hypothetical protein